LCCGTTLDTSRAAFGSTYVQTGYSLYIKGNPADPNGAHAGFYDSTKYVKGSDPSQWEGINFSSTVAGQKIVVSGLQIVSNRSQDLCIYMASSTCASAVTINRCILHSIIEANSTGIVWQRNNTSTLLMTNCVMNGRGYAPYGISAQGTATSIYNCLITGTTTGVVRYGGTVTVKNCSVFNNNDDFGVSITTIDHCASDDGDGDNPIAVSSWSAQFVKANYATASDFRLRTDSVLRNAGVGPASDANVPTDSMGSAYRYGSTTDVGPFNRTDYKAKGSSSGVSSQSGV